jgi:hypothetical protein
MDTYVDQFGVRRYFDTDEEAYPSTGSGGGPDEPYNYTGDGVTMRPGTATGAYGSTTSRTSPGENYQTYNEDPELMAQQQSAFNSRFPQQNYPPSYNNYTQPVEFQTGFALDTTYPNDTIGRVRFFRGQNFLKTPMGWMKQ